MATGRSGDRSRTRSRGVWYVCNSRSPLQIVEPRPALAALLRTTGPPERGHIVMMGGDVKKFRASFAKASHWTAQSRPWHDAVDESRPARGARTSRNADGVSR